MFTFQELERLMKVISSFRSTTWKTVPAPKILFLGVPGCGKSSFVSSVNKVFHGAGAQLAYVAEGVSITRQASTYFS